MFIAMFPLCLQAQEEGKQLPETQLQGEPIAVEELPDSLEVGDSLDFEQARLILPDSIMNDTLPDLPLKNKWIPDPNRAVWLATLFPGAGQIYNRKYWKLPIYYGGFVACTYALTWNNRMYKDYSQGYADLMDSDPSTDSFKDFLSGNYNYESDAVISQLQTIFKNKKDYYRKYRDLSIFAFVGVYLLSVIDAYVDAELSNFDISEDLSMGISPAIIDDNKSRARCAYGVQYVLTF